MARSPRIVIPGCPHHVTQRGNHRQNVFLSTDDQPFYLDLMRRQFRSHKISLVGYCLMTNHVHHALIPPTEESLSRAVGRLHQYFARWQHLRCNRTGHLWQNRFFSCPVHDVWEVLAYIELNPVRAGLVKEAWDWKWSSARAHVTCVDDTGLLDMVYWQQCFDASSWKNYLETAAARDQIHEGIRSATSAGRFWGPDEVMKQLESRLGKSIERKRRGRPRKKM